MEGIIGFPVLRVAIKGTMGFRGTGGSIEASDPVQV
jgi:hypothetical protein